jgi:hypothetical protein
MSGMPKSPSQASRHAGISAPRESTYAEPAVAPIGAVFPGVTGGSIMSAMAAGKAVSTGVVTTGKTIFGGAYTAAPNNTITVTGNSTSASAPHHGVGSKVAGGVGYAYVPVGYYLAPLDAPTRFTCAGYNRSLHAFIRGAGSLSLFPDATKVLGRLSNEGIGRDWQRVGADLKRAMAAISATDSKAVDAA